MNCKCLSFGRLAQAKDTEGVCQFVTTSKRAPSASCSVSCGQDSSDQRQILPFVTQVKVLSLHFSQSLMLRHPFYPEIVWSLETYHLYCQNCLLHPLLLVRPRLRLMSFSSMARSPFSKVPSKHQVWLWESARADQMDQTESCPSHTIVLHAFWSVSSVFRFLRYRCTSLHGREGTIWESWLCIRISCGTCRARGRDVWSRVGSNWGVSGCFGTFWVRPPSFSYC